MVLFWVIVAVVLIVLGLFLMTQGAGPTVASVGGIIVLVLLIIQSVT